MNQAGLRDAEFCEFVAANRDRLVRTAILICGDPHHAEDLVQSALTKVFLRLHRLSLHDVQAYARRCVVTAHVDETRRPWRRERTQLDHVIEPRAVEVMAYETAEELWSAIRALPKRQRQVVVLRHYWGLSIAETAADLRVSVGTVKSQDSNARAALRRHLTTVESEQS